MSLSVLLGSYVSVYHSSYDPICPSYSYWDPLGILYLILLVMCQCICISCCVICGLSTGSWGIAFLGLHTFFRPGESCLFKDSYISGIRNPSSHLAQLHLRS